MTQTVEDPATAAPSFKDQLTSYALADLFSTALADYVRKHRRPETFAVLHEKYVEDGAKSSNVFHDGEVVATATVNEPKGRVEVTDADAFLEWVETYFESEVQTIIQVNPVFAKQVTEKLTEPADKKESGDVFVKDTTVTAEAGVVGQPVPGLAYVPPGEPRSFSVRWKSPEHKRAALTQLLTDLAPALGVSPEALTEAVEK